MTWVDFPAAGKEWLAAHVGAGQLQFEMMRKCKFRRLLPSWQSYWWCALLLLLLLFCEFCEFCAIVCCHIHDLTFIISRRLVRRCALPGSGWAVDGGTAACEHSHRHTRREKAREEHLSILRDEAKKEKELETEQAAAAAAIAGVAEAAVLAEEVKEGNVSAFPAMQETRACPVKGQAAAALAAEEAKVRASLAARAWRSELSEEDRLAIGQSCKRLLDVRCLVHVCVQHPPYPACRNRCSRVL